MTHGWAERIEVIPYAETKEKKPLDTKEKKDDQCNSSGKAVEKQYSDKECNKQEEVKEVKVDKKNRSSRS